MMETGAELRNEITVAELLSGVFNTTVESSLREIEAPLDWEYRQSCSDWRNYIPRRLARAWDRLPLEAKAVAYVIGKAMEAREP